MILSERELEQGESIDYTSNLLGNIRSHLQGLQGFDTMALELIQNADDAKAKQIVFDIQDNGLLVWNSGAFSYCGDLYKRPCPYYEADGYSCDFHRISDFGSGGKLSSSENIGRFGIGFSSTYQIADQPEIHSSGLKLTLVPEEGKCYPKSHSGESGTTFYLPWATDPNSLGRQALGVSHITSEHIEQLTKDCQNVLYQSLLFLRHLEKAELRRNGKVLLIVELDRGDDSELLVSFEPSGDLERWFIIRADAANDTSSVFEKYPQLKLLDRKTEISIAIRVDPSPLEEGLLYAFLPTKQSTGLPFHLNADFFPEGSRKTIIFEGHQHPQAWNELLVQTAANTLASNIEVLRDRLGYSSLWEILSAALVVAQDNKSRYPESLKSFWHSLKRVVDNGAKIGYSVKEEYKSPSDLLIPRKPLSNQEKLAFHQVGGELINEDLRSHRNAFILLGAKDLTLERFVSIVETPLTSLNDNGGKATKHQLDVLYQPLWSVVHDLLPDVAPTSTVVIQAIQRLKNIPFVLDTNLKIASIEQCYRAPGDLLEDTLSISFPFLTFVSEKLALFTRPYNLVDIFDIACAATELEAKLNETEENESNNINNSPETLQELYTLLSRIDGVCEEDDDAYKTLRSLPIWLTGNGVSSLEHVLLPGDFEDPTGQSELLDQEKFSTEARYFIERKLKVKRQTIEVYVRIVVPLFFRDDGPKEFNAYKSLILSLANHAGLLDNDEIRLLLEETPLVPAKDDGWYRANNLYYRTDELSSLLGDNNLLWVDENRLPSERSVHAFIENLGLLKSPIPRHLVDRLLTVSETFSPDIKARKASEISFYALCEIYDEDNVDGSIRAEIGRLTSTNSFPVVGDTENWYMPEDIYAPFRYQAFQSQANILDFKNTQKLNSTLLDLLSISKKPETVLVVSHLLYCVSNQEPVSNLVYQVLNERAKQDGEELSRLQGKPCIYISSLERYVRPNQLYLVPQNLGKYSFSVPAELVQYKELFTAIGVKNTPVSQDYIDIILDIVEENYPRQSQLTAEDSAIYHYCMEALVHAWDISDAISEDDILRLKQAPTILSITGLFCHPDEILLHDSEWHSGHFGNELSPMLCKPDPTWWPLLIKLGVAKLTSRASVDLEYVEGVKQVEEQIRDKMLERCNVFTRMLHDKSAEMRKRLATALKDISVSSYDEVRIVASVLIGEVPVSSEPTSVKAFCDESIEKLALSRPMSGRSWLHIFTVLLHRLFPEESASYIAQTSMNFYQMIGMSVSEAEEFLTEANIPLINVENSTDNKLNLESPKLEEIGEDEDNGAQDDLRTSTRVEENDSQLSDVRPETKEHKIDQEYEKNGANGKKGSFNENMQQVVGGTKNKSPRRNASKKIWDRKLISYVKQLEPDDEQDSEGSRLDREYKLSIEAASRVIVCAYEKERGRNPEEMAQTHPGYDIISRRAGSDDVERYIEVKGTSGEWKNRGVSVSRLQFSEAQNYGDKYWLYVVENALDESCARIHVIQSPAMKVDSFMFDSGWRDVAIDEAADPTLRFKEGFKVDCGLLGVGIIEKVENRGMTKSLLVDFGGDRGKKYMALNLKTMKVIEEDEPDNT